MSKTNTIARMAATLLAKYGDLEVQRNALYLRSCAEAARALYAEVERQERQAYSPTKEDDGA